MDFAYRPDAQAFDEIRIVTIPRYKESGLSGSEWRISAEVQFYRNGNLIHQEGHFRDVETAAKFLAFTHARACDDGHAYFAGEQGFCDQEGCSNKPFVFFKRKKHYGHCGHEKEKYGDSVRKFCAEHERRGDGAIDDCDDNYDRFIPA